MVWKKIQVRTKKKKTLRKPQVDLGKLHVSRAMLGAVRAERLALLEYRGLLRVSKDSEQQGT